MAIIRYVNIQVELEEFGAAQNIIPQIYVCKYMTFILAFSIGVQNSHKLLTGAEHHSIAMIPNLKPSYSSYIHKEADHMCPSS
jgi:hypothetical protein